MIHSSVYIRCMIDFMSIFCYLFSYVLSIVFFFFFKQKTAYEMRISDWSSDVCSSDLFWRRLRQQSGSAARALELTILCATRTSETLNATWSEFDLDSALWTIPKERMKMHVEHRVPLSNSAVELLRATAANSNRPPDAYVFAGQKRGCPLSNVSMTDRKSTRLH